MVGCRSKRDNCKLGRCGFSQEKVCANKKCGGKNSTMKQKMENKYRKRKEKKKTKLKTSGEEKEKIKITRRSRRKSIRGIERTIARGIDNLKVKVNVNVNVSISFNFSRPILQRKS